MILGNSDAICNLKEYQAIWSIWLYVHDDGYGDSSDYERKKVTSHLLAHFLSACLSSSIDLCFSVSVFVGSQSLGAKWKGDNDDSDNPKEMEPWSKASKQQTRNKTTYVARVGGSMTVEH